MAYLTGYASIARRAASGVIPSIATSHPLARGLLAAYYPATAPNGTLQNLVAGGNGNLTTRVGVAVGLSPTPEGPGLLYSGQATASFGGACPSTFQLSSGQSLFVRMKRGPTVYQGGHVAYLFGVAITSSPFNCYIIGTGLNGSTGNGQLGLLYQTTASSYIGTAILPLNTMASAGATFGSGAPGKLYVNGAQDTVTGSPPNVNITTYTPNPTIYLGLQNTTDSVYATITVAYIWGRPLNDGEHRYLDANPYSLLRWPVDIVYDTIENQTTVLPSGVIVNKPMIFSPLMLAGVGGLEWLRKRKIKMRQLRGQ